MPQKRSEMKRVKEVLRLAHELGYSGRQISASVRLGRSAVSDYLKRADAVGIRYQDIISKSELEIEALLFKPSEPTQSRPLPDFAQVAVSTGNQKCITVGE
jgi:hypothetical protein